jgi:hypothetical protein
MWSRFDDDNFTARTIVARRAATGEVHVLDESSEGVIAGWFNSPFRHAWKRTAAPGMVVRNGASLNGERARSDT